MRSSFFVFFFFFQAEDGIRDKLVTEFRRVLFRSVAAWFAATESSSWSISVGKSVRSHAAATRPPSALTPMGTTRPRHGSAPSPTSGMISLRDNRPAAARFPCSHSGNAFHASPRVTSTAAPPVGSHKRTNAKSRNNDPTSTSARPVAISAGPLPSHATGMVETATRSLSAVRSRKISALGSMYIQLAMLALLPVYPSLPYLEEELVRRNEERILVQQPAHDHDRVRAHDVHCQRGAYFRQIVRTDHRILVLRKHVVDPCLVFEQIIDAWLVQQRPFHVRQQPRERVPPCRARLEDFFDQGQHGVLIEAISAKVSLLPRPHLQLARAHCPLHVDARCREPLQMVLPQIGVHDVESSFSPVQAVLDERAQDPVLLVDAVRSEE